MLHVENFSYLFFSSHERKFTINGNLTTTVIIGVENEADKAQKRPKFRFSNICLAPPMSVRYIAI